MRDLFLRGAFDRGEDYAGLEKALSDACKTLAGLTPQEINRVLRKLRRDYEAIRDINSFPHEKNTQAEAAWIDFVNVAETLLSPGEPQKIDTDIPRRDLSAYQEV